MKSTNIVLLLVVYVAAAMGKARAPNIVFIIADDLGWNDVSFHGSDQILTPNIDLLAYSGVALGRYYSHAICTPSRSAILTGKYAHRTGMQGYPLIMSEDRGIPTNITILPQYLKLAGYKTHLVGKWHVGSSRDEFLPTKRGFDSHFGHRCGYMDYYEYTLEEWVAKGPETGFSLYDNFTPAWDVEGYITDVYTNKAKSIIEKHDTSTPLFLMLAHNAPHSGNDGALLQAPPDLVRKMRHVESPHRRILAAMIKKLDDSVGEIVQTLNDKGILNDTIIVFVSDNGGMTSGVSKNYGSNYPLRGTKVTPFEGGVRVAGLIWSMSHNNSNNYWNGYIHACDWLPTLLTAAGLKIPTDIDGISQWDNINSNADSSRNVIYEVDDYYDYASITYGEYKLLTGKGNKEYSTYQGGDLRGIIGKAPSYTDTITKSVVYGILKSHDMDFNIRVREYMTVNCDHNVTSVCVPDTDTVCLYNIIEDPCETTDLSCDFPVEVTAMKSLLEAEMAKRIPRVVPTYRDPLSAPNLHNYTWAPWIKS